MENAKKEKASKPKTDKSYQLKGDIPSKNLLKIKSIVAAILQQGIDDFKDFTVDEIREALPDKFSFNDTEVSEDIISDMNVEDRVPNEKSITFDMLFHTVPKNECHVEIFCDIEPQGIYPLEDDRIPDSYDLPMRAVYYICRMISIQLRYGKGKTKNYRDLKKCYGIWLCFDKLYDTKAVDVGFAKYGMVLKECSPNLREFLEREQKAMDLMEIIIVRTGGELLEGEQKSLPDLINTIWRGSKNISKYISPKDPDIEQINEEVPGMCNMIDVMNNHMETQIKKQVEKQVKEQVEKQVNRRLENERAKIRAEGIAEGIAEGEAKGIISTLMEYGISKEQIIDKIKDKLGVSQEKAMKYYSNYLKELQ